MIKVGDFISLCATCRQRERERAEAEQKLAAAQLLAEQEKAAAQKALLAQLLTNLAGSKNDTIRIQQKLEDISKILAGLESSITNVLADVALANVSATEAKALSSEQKKDFDLINSMFVKFSGHPKDQSVQTFLDSVKAESDQIQSRLKELQSMFSKFTLNDLRTLLELSETAKQQLDTLKTCANANLAYFNCQILVKLPNAQPRQCPSQCKP